MPVVFTTKPFGIYPGTKASLDELEDGDVIAVPNDTTNEARALLVARGKRSNQAERGCRTYRYGKGYRRKPEERRDPELEAAQVPRVRMR